eukprot:3690872-Heterocapsa_arctica.AAC.1
MEGVKHGFTSKITTTSATSTVSSLKAAALSPPSCSCDLLGAPPSSHHPVAARTGIRRIHLLAPRRPQNARVWYRARMNLYPEPNTARLLLSIRAEKAQWPIVTSSCSPVIHLHFSVQRRPASRRQ